MPKRIIDGDALYTSRKLAQVEPPEFRGHYVWFVPLALGNGVFECDPSRVWEASCAFNRPEISVETVEQSFAEYERVGLLVRWREPDGKEWIRKGSRALAQGSPDPSAFFSSQNFLGSKGSSTRGG